MRIYHSIWRCIQCLSNRDHWFCNVCQIIGNFPLVSKNNVCCFFRYILISAGICLGPHSFHSVFGFSRRIQWNGGTWYLWLPGAVALYSHCNYNSILPILFLATEYWLGGYCPLLEEQITCRSHTLLALECFHIISLIGLVHLFCSYLEYHVWVLHSLMLY